MSRAVVPEFPQFRRDTGREMRDAFTVTVEPSRMDEDGPLPAAAGLVRCS